MARKICNVCVHPSQEIRDWFDRGESVEFICSKSPQPQLLPSDIEFHSRHSSRKVTLAEPAAVALSSDRHETIESRREELKRKLDQVSTVYDREIASPSTAKALKDIAQEFRMLIAQLNQIDSEISANQKVEAQEINAREGDDCGIDLGWEFFEGKLVVDDNGRKVLGRTSDRKHTLRGFVYTLMKLPFTRDNLQLTPQLQKFLELESHVEDHDDILEYTRRFHKSCPSITRDQARRNLEFSRGSLKQQPFGAEEIEGELDLEGFARDEE